MSAPFGMPQPASAQSSEQRPGGGPDLVFLLPLVAAGLGLLGWLLGFFDQQTAWLLRGMPGFGLLGAAALAGMRALPKSPNTLIAAAPLSVFATLVLLQYVFTGGAGSILAGGGPSGVVIVLVFAAVLQSAAIVGVLLLEAGVLKSSLASGFRAGNRSNQPTQQVGRPAGQQPGFGQYPGAQPQGRDPKSGPQAAQQPQPYPQAGGWGQQPGGWSPQQNPQPHQPAPGQQGDRPGQAPGGQFDQPGQGRQFGQPGAQGQQGPQGTQHMPHPGRHE